MAQNETVEELYKLLMPYIQSTSAKKDWVLKEDVDGVIEDAVAFGVAEKFLSRVQANPGKGFWELFKEMALKDIPEGTRTPPGQEDLLEEILKDEEE